MWMLLVCLLYLAFGESMGIYMPDFTACLGVNRSIDEQTAPAGVLCVCVCVRANVCACIFSLGSANLP